MAKKRADGRYQVFKMINGKRKCFMVLQQNDMYGEEPITDEHVQNNSTIREMLAERGIKPEELPAEKDLKKVERKINKHLKSIDNNPQNKK